MIYMMKFLNGAELAGYIKQRQAKQVRALIQANKINPKLAIVVCNHNHVSSIYANLKQKYGKDILIDVEIYKIDQAEAESLIEKLNKDRLIHGIIVQLPLLNPEQTDEILNCIEPSKDVDGLALKSNFDMATPTAILWLLSGYNIDLMAKNIVIIGRGRLVGSPLKTMLDKSGINTQVIHSQTKNPQNLLNDAQIIITAVGKPGIINSAMIPQNCIVVDAGTASDKGKQKGDLADDVYNREDLTITPKIGGIGPLTVCALFDNLIRAASNTKNE
jgi:methylenetetrahydrofolate dehydrogenase (NADP+)/methenyltetrahydrofolate cyclohydrolase